MKSLLLDVMGLTGFGLLTVGFYLRFGLPCALMLSGFLMLSGALLAVRRKRAP